MLDQYRSDLAIIAEEIGLATLMHGHDTSLSFRGKNQHTMRYHWRKASQFIATVDSSCRDFSECKSLAYIETMGMVFEKVRHLKGYSTRIKPELCKPAKYIKNEYVMLTANDLVDAGCDVEFATERPKEGIRVADLMVSGGGAIAWVECKRKQELQTGQFDPPDLATITKRLDELSANRIGNSHIQIAVIGTENGVIQSTIDELSRLDNEFEGFSISQDAGSSIFVSKTVPIPKSPLQIYKNEDLLAYLPGGPIACSSSITFNTQEGKIDEILQRKSWWAYTLEAHGFQSTLILQRWVGF